VPERVFTDGSCAAKFNSHAPYHYKSKNQPNGRAITVNGNTLSRIGSSDSEPGLDVKDFVLIILVPFVVVSLALGTKSFWGDEILSLNFSGQNFPSLLNSLASDYHPPLYFIALKAWIGIGGNSEIILRAFQGIQGALFLMVSLLLFRMLLPNHRYHPFWLLLISSSELWLFMPMLRYYTFAAVLAIFSSLMFFKWLERIDRRTTFLLAISYILLLYTDYPASSVLAFHFAYVMFKKRALIPRLIMIDVAALFFFSPWVLITVRQIHALLNLHQAADLNLSPKVIPLKIAYSLSAFVLGEMIYPFEVLGIGIVLLIVITLIASSSRLPQVFDDATAWYASGLAITGIVCTSLITTFVSTHTSFIYTPSRTFFGLPFLFLFFGIVYSKIHKVVFKYILIGAFLVANIYGISNWITNRHFLMPVYATPWKEVLDDVKGESGIILVDESLCYSYYRSTRQGTYPALQAPESIHDLYTSTDQQPHVFLVLMGRESTEPELRKDIVEYITTRGTKLFERKYLLLDESYRNIKSRILGRDTYDAKLTLLKYELPPLSKSF
jgi:hypothetical protein